LWQPRLAQSRQCPREARSTQPQMCLQSRKRGQARGHCGCATMDGRAQKCDGARHGRSTRHLIEGAWPARRHTGATRPCQPAPSLARVQWMGLSVLGALCAMRILFWSAPTWAGEWAAHTRRHLQPCNSTP